MYKEGVLRKIKLTQIKEDESQPRRDFGMDGDKNRIALSVKRWGVLEPLLVVDNSDNTFTIVDGHRRYRSAKKTGLTEIDCKVLPKDTDKGELEIMRYEAQNNRRSWKPLERAADLQKIKEATGLETPELAKILNMSKTIITNSLLLKNIEEKYLKLLDKYELTGQETYVVEFVKLHPKIRDIDDKFTIKDIVDKIFYKTRHQIIRSSKEYRTLGRIFKRTEANKKEIVQFLNNQDMDVRELADKTILTGLSLQIEQLGESVAKRLQNGNGFEQKEKKSLAELKEILIKAV